MALTSARAFSEQFSRTENPPSMDLGGSCFDRKEADMSEDVSLVVLEMIFGYWKTQLLRAMATLSIADILAKAPATLESLAAQTGANKDGLARLLRAAASIGMVGYDDGRYVSTSKLDVLRGDAPISLKAMAIAHPHIGCRGVTFPIVR
jgi:methyltransferase family protein